MIEDAPILLAEDNEDDILAMRLALREAGLPNRLLIARNGQEVVSHFKSERAGADSYACPQPRLLLLDLRLPLMDGFDVLAWLQQRRRPENLMVVVLTASTRKTDLGRYFELGADACLVKPGTFTQLVDMVRGLRQHLEETPNASPGFALAR